MSVTWDPPPVSVEQDVKSPMGQERDAQPAAESSRDAAGGARPSNAWLVAVRPRLVRLARRFVWNEHDAEEIAQEALAVAWEAAGRLRDANKRDAWAYRCTANLAMNHLRRRRTQPVVREQEPATDDDAVAGSLQTSELARRVRLAMAELPQRQQAALILREMEGMTYEEIAAVLETKSATARLLVHRARESLRQMLLRQSPDSFGPDR